MMMPPSILISTSSQWAMNAVPPGLRSIKSSRTATAPDGALATPEIGRQSWLPKFTQDVATLIA